MNERIVFMGTPEFAANVLEGLIRASYNITAVVTQPDKKVGRKNILTPSPVKETALRYGIPVFTPVRIKDDYEDILKTEPDLIITSAYGQFVPVELIEYPRYRAINTHGSLLPQYRGGAPIQWSIINGEEKTGISIIYMTKGMDKGDILYRKEIPIDIRDTNSTLFRKLSDLALECLLEFLPDLFAGNFRAEPQKEEEATFAYNLSKSDEFISFNDRTRRVYDHIRGLLDDPGAYGILKGKKYKFMKVFYAEAEGTKPGLFRGLESDYLRIDCLDGFIKVYEIKPEGKNTMDARSFYNGNGRNLVGEYFSDTYEE